MNERDDGGITRYLRACFAWEYAHVGDVRLDGTRTRQVEYPTVETLASGLSTRPALAREAHARLVATLARHGRSSTVLQTLFAVATPAGDGERRASLAPLFVADIDDPDDWLDEEGASGVPVRALVNRTLLERLCPDEASADGVAARLRARLDEGPLDKRAATALAEILASAVPGLRSEGFEHYPLLVADPSASDSRDRAVRLLCTAPVLVVRRSRRSRGVLHELGELDADSEVSASFGALVGRYRPPGGTLLDRFPGPTRARTPRGDHAHPEAPGTLSRAQRRAVVASGRHALSLVHGPPGTGKTHTLAMLVSDTVARGGSVLVCSRSAAAVDVVERFLATRLQLGGAIVRGGDPRAQRALKGRLQDVLSAGTLRFDRPHPTLAALDGRDASPADLARTIRHATRERHRLERAIGRHDRSIDRAVAIARGAASARERCLSWLRSLSGGSSPLVLAELAATRRGLIERRSEAVVERLQLAVRQRVARLLVRDRTALARLADSLTARERRQRELQGSLDYRSLLVPFPVWLTTLVEVGQLVPLERELFDLVIVDEASQVDCASALPALQRARRAVVLGDARQLRHLSFLPGEIEETLRERYAPSVPDVPRYRGESLLDWCERRIEDPRAVSLLDEHFRSHPDIVGFSAEHFYGNRLRLLTTVRPPASDGRGALELVHVANGRRGRNDVNREEAERVLERLRTLVGAHDPALDATTIAVLSPFRAQVDHLEGRLRRELDAASLERHRLVVGTAHELQGEERDVVLFSAAVDDRASGGSLAFLSRPDVLNVSITRARHRQVLFLSRDPARFDDTTLFGRYVRYVATRSGTGRDDGEDRKDRAGTDATGMIGALAALASSDCSVRHDVRVGPVTLALLFRRHGASLGIERIASDGPKGASDLPYRDRLDLLQRLAIAVLPITDTDWRDARPGVLAHVAAALDALGRDASSGETR